MNKYTIKADAIEGYKEFTALKKEHATIEAKKRLRAIGKTQVVYNNGEFAFEISEIKRVDSFSNVQYSF
jgi:hypothetical protein